MGNWEKLRPDAVMLVGLLVMIYTGLKGAWGAFALGVLLLLIGLFAPRMKGPFSVGGPKLSFKGELTDPDGSTPELDAQPALLLGPGPPASSPPPTERQQ